MKRRDLFQILLIQYDPERRKKRHLYYHYLDKNKPDKLIAKIRKAEAYDLSFKVSCDYKYLILCGSRILCIANIENLMEDIKFKMIFEIQDASYVSNQYALSMYAFIGDLNFSSKRMMNKQEYVGNDADFFLFLTNVGAPMHHLIEVDIRNKKPRNHVDVIVAVSDQ